MSTHTPAVPDPSDVPPRPRSRFQPRTCTAEQMERIESVRTVFDALAGTIEFALQPSREKSIVTTKLEEACMWAVKGISHENG